MEICRLDSSWRRQVTDLVLETFHAFVAPGYSREGVNSFCAFVEDEASMEALSCWGAVEKGELAGVLAANSSGSHVCLFFVAAGWQGKGIGRQLWERFLQEGNGAEITVHASPFAVPIYRRLGFHATAEEQQADGMRYTPMTFRR